MAASDGDSTTTATATMDLDAYGFVESGVPIGRYLRCPRTGWDFVLHARAPPPLFVDVDRFAPYRDTSIPLLLDAVARIQQRSLELDAFPGRKAEFWAAIFPLYGKASDLQLGVEKWMMEDPAFPHIVLSFHQMTITKTRLDMLLRFATSSTADKDAPQLPSIGLKFTQCEGFGTEALALLIAFFDALFAHPARRFAVRSLNLSSNQMNIEQLVLLRELLAKNRRVYRIQDIALNDIFFSRDRESDEADQLSAMLRTMFTRDEPSCSRDPFVLKRLSFDHSSFRLQHFAAMCSALRYGSPVEELSLLSTLNRVSAEDRRQCWRWLAFALFCPRSSRHRQDFRLEKIELSRIELRVADAKAIKDTLKDPTGELVYNGRRPAGAVVEPVALCRVRDGASIYESPSVTSTCTSTLPRELALEVLVRDANGWACVVVPGVGLGWVLVSHVSVDHESSYAPEIDNLLELTIHCLSSKKTPITLLLESIGRHLRFLSLKFSVIDIAAILTHCVNLKHLDIEGCNFPRHSLDALFAEAHKPVFKQLLSLNLNDTATSDFVASRLAEALSSQDQPPPALKELRFVSAMLTNEAFERIHEMLLVNKTLTVVELLNPTEGFRSAEMYERFEQRHQDRLLQIAGCVRERLAFLSVLVHELILGRPQSLLDSNLAAAVLEFAGTPVRRRVMWRVSPDGDY